MRKAYAREVGAETRSTVAQGFLMRQPALSLREVPRLLIVAGGDRTLGWLDSNSVDAKACHRL
jgi:hypothetical protein